MIHIATPQPARHAAPTVRAQSLAYLTFARPDLAAAERFLTDFGLRTVAAMPDALLLRAADDSPFCYVVRRELRPRFVGFALRVAARSDLERLAQLPGASAIEPLQLPGGGEVVRLTDPSGFEIEAVCGQEKSTMLAHRAPLPLNEPGLARRINATQRLVATAPEVLKLGHVVLEVADFQATCAWYTQHFGFIPSDVQVLPDGTPAVTFLRLDLGATPADHHTLALAQGFMPAYSHSAYEVVDADAIGMGHRVLRESGWKHAWGLGRHILGSQLFDYWEDSCGAKHEHYCDGDVFTADVPTGVHPLTRSGMAQWGQRMPASFTKPRLTLRTIAALLHYLRHSPDVTLRKLRTLARAFA
ncbi:MAG TPA: VOC family protein [Steroidobacteraceae bacterium]|jgi:catechol 2,3-dioxygenase-like lactoylglutathione lyase family enzyme